MSQKQSLTEKDLVRCAKQFREQAGKTRAQAAREMKVSQTSIFQAEESPEQGLVKLRKKMIEAYSSFRLVGPVFYLRKKS